MTHFDAAAPVMWQAFANQPDLKPYQAEQNRIAVVPIVPNRGLIVDRNGVVLATNYSAYTLEITPSKLEAPLDATIDKMLAGRHDQQGEEAGDV